MKRSRLSMFKATSMTISVLGVVMIIVTIAIIAFIGFNSLSGFISSDVSKKELYNELSGLKTNASQLNSQYDALKLQVQKANSKTISTAYVTADLENIKSQSAVSDVESALSAGEPPDEVQDRINAAKTQIEKARASLSSVRAML
jgi:hypothetical protein